MSLMSAAEREWRSPVARAKAITAQCTVPVDEQVMGGMRERRAIISMGLLDRETLSLDRFGGESDCHDLY